MPPPMPLILVGRWTEYCSSPINVARGLPVGRHDHPMCDPQRSGAARPEHLAVS